MRKIYVVIETPYVLRSGHWVHDPQLQRYNILTLQEGQTPLGEELIDGKTAKVEYYWTFSTSAQAEAKVRELKRNQ